MKTATYKRLTRAEKKGNACKMLVGKSQ